MTFCRSPFELSALELASGLVFGSEAGSAAPAEGDDLPHEPLRALERAVLPALLRPPCVVSFSGGRDSSAVLAVAAALARREGLPLPVPATNVFPAEPGSDESEWQQVVIRHLGLDDWVRIELHDELDCAGALARSILDRHGLLWPFNAHFHWPLLEIARGGTLLTGVGGDELLGMSHWARAASILSRTVRPSRRDLPRLTAALAPSPLRRVALRRRYAGERPFAWLTDEANEELVRATADEIAGEPMRWSRRWAWWRGRREVGIGFTSLELIAADCGATIEHPLTDHAFAAAVARLAATRRLHDRASVMRAVFEPVLTPEILTRASKAAFGAVFWGPQSRSLAPVLVDALAGLGTVDVGRLREVWSRRSPDAHTFLLLQALLLRDRAPEEQPPAVRI
jgi:asparagine synthase (glutamine-hydrolysing)